MEQKKKEESVCFKLVKIKKTDDLEFDIPEKWITAHIENITESVASKQYQIKESEVKTSGKHMVISQSQEYSIGFSDDTNKLYHHDAPVIVFGDHTAVVKIVDFDFIVGADGVKIFAPNLDVLDPRFFFLEMQYYTRGLNKVGGYSRHYKFIKDKPFVVPPLEEQKRIVAKIEELMPFVEQYAKASTRLNMLNASFPDQMKKSILQQAVMGKLVPQDPNDEPASVLLKKIAEEKQKLIKEGKIKKSKYDFRVEYKDGKYSCVSPKSISVIDDLIFDIPESWSFCTLADLVQFVGGYAYKSNTFVEYSPYQVLRLGNVKNDLIKRDTNPVFIPEELANSTLDFKCEENDILLTMTGTRLKRDYFFTVRVGDNDTNLFVNQRVGCLRPYDGEMSEWLTYILKSNFVLDYIFDFETGTANQGNLGAENIMKIIVPLPPKNEQKRIVEKLKEILPLDEVLTSKS